MANDLKGCVLCERGGGDGSASYGHLQGERVLDLFPASSHPHTRSRKEMYGSRLDSNPVSTSRIRYTGGLCTPGSGVGELSKLVFGHRCRRYHNDVHDSNPSRGFTI
jgi:hypothetical protein